MNRITECQGTSLIGSCPSEHNIAVKGVQYGTKLTSICSLSNSSAGCCDYDAADCLIPYNGTSQQDDCSGRELCVGVTVAAADTSSCGANYPVLNHYLTMEYYCVAGKLTLFGNRSVSEDPVAAADTNSCGASNYPVLKYCLTTEYYM